jgi:hypothetical protein
MKENKGADALSRVQINNDITDEDIIPTDQTTTHDMASNLDSKASTYELGLTIFDTTRESDLNTTQT